MATTVAHTVLEFVSNTNPIPTPDPSPLPTTGDAMGTIVLLLASVLAASLCLLAASFMRSRAAAPAGAHARPNPHATQRKTFSKLLIVLAAFCLITGSALAYTQSAGAAANIGITEKVTVVVNEDGEIESIGTATLQNDSGAKIAFQQSTATFTEAVSDPDASGLSDLVLTASIPDGIVFSGAVNGGPYGNMPDAIIVPEGSASISFDIQGLSAGALTALVNRGPVIEFTFELVDVFDISFILDGEGTDPATIEVRNGQPYGDLPVPERTGYDFLGWFTAPEGGTQVTADTICNLKADQMLFPHWKAHKYKLTLDANGGTVDGKETAKRDVYYDQPYGELPVPEFAYHDFLGWFTAKDGGSQISPDMIYAIADKQTVYAHWQTQESNLTLDANGGLIDGQETAGKTVICGQPYGELPVPELTGYDFLGWFTAADGGDQVTADTICESKADQTLFAQWAAKTFTLTLDANGGTVDDQETATRTVTYGQAIGTDCLPQAEHAGNWNFTGWFTAAEGGDQVTAETVVSQTNDFTLYAQWEDDKVNVTFDTCGGTWESGGAPVSNPYTFTVGEKYNPLPTAKWSNSPNVNGYTFAGWFTAKDGGDQVTSDTEVATYKDHTLYAHWTAKTIELLLNGNGGTINGKTNATVDVTFGDTYAAGFDQAKAERTGYDLKGYFNIESGGVQTQPNDTVTVAYNHQLYAQWAAQTYNITVKDADEEAFSGKLPEGFPTTHTYDKATPVAAPAKYGYTFNGWYTAPDCSGTAVTELAADGYTADITLYAKWTPIRATVTFDANGGEGTMANQVFDKGEKQNLSICRFTPIDMTEQAFLNWNTKADGTGDAYEAGEEVTFLEDATLYAQWIEPLFFVAATDGSTVKITVEEGEFTTAPEFVCSDDHGQTWKEFSFDTPVTLSEGRSLFVRAKTANDSLAESKGGGMYAHVNFKVTGQAGAYGNTMSLLDSTCQQTEVPAYAFISLFAGSTIMHAPDLPATTLGEHSYDSMFSGCQNLTKTAAMDATTLATSCCKNMYGDCTGLTNAGTLPATALEEACYEFMFAGCTKLKTAPDLPANTLAESCYRSMFQKSGVTTVVLPATELAPYCYEYMFSLCPDLTTAPSLPATALEPGCYLGMFIMSNVASSPTLPASTLAEECYRSMFASCTTLTKAPQISATTFAKKSCQDMFNGCTALASSPALAATTLAESSCQGMFAGCTSLASAPGIPATTVAKSSCRDMFNGCTALKSSPLLSAETLAENCYNSMFANCTSLNSAGAIKAKTLAERSCQGMFASCSALKTAPALSSDLVMAEYSCNGMFQGTGLTAAPNLQIAVMAPHCCEMMFAGCGSMTKAGSIQTSLMADYCCREMFHDCLSLTSAGTITAEGMAPYSCADMFANCKKLTEAPALNCSVMAKNCYESMFCFCESLEVAPRLIAEELAADCYRSMFMKCLKLRDIRVDFTSWDNGAYTSFWMMGVSGWPTVDGEFYGPISLSLDPDSYSYDTIPPTWTFQGIVS